MDAFWQAGDHIVLRYWRANAISYVFPVTIANDGPELTALYLAAGTSIKKRVKPSGEPIPRDLPYTERAKLPVTLGEGVWRQTNVLILFRPGEAHDVRLFFDQRTNEFLRFYVNLQQPPRRSQAGFDTADNVLDVEIEPDRSWRWKDQDEFEDAQKIGRFSPDEATAIVREGRRVIEDATNNRWPFNAGWEHWRPDPTCHPLELPEGWAANA